MSIYHDEVEIEDFEYDEEEEMYYYPCPCGDRFQISKVCANIVTFWNYFKMLFWLLFSGGTHWGRGGGNVSQLFVDY